MKTDGLFVAGVGTYLPGTRIPVAEAVRRGWCAEETGQIGWEAAWVAGGTPAPDLAVRAARQAIERSGGNADGIDILLYGGAHHQGPDGWCPPQYVQRNTIGGDILAVGLANSCHAMMYGLELAANHLLAAPERRAALLCTGDNWDTPLFDRWRAHESGVFSDAGSAMVISRTGGFARLLSVCSKSKPELEELSRGVEPIHPPGVTLGRKMDFEARYDGYESELLQQAAKLVPEVLGAAVEQTLAEGGDLERGRIARVVHQAAGSATLLQMVLLEPLGFTPEQSTLAFGQANGRTGCSDQFAAFDHLVTSGELTAGDRVLFVGSGPGMIVTCALVEMLEPPAWAA